MNPILEIVERMNKPAYKIARDELNGVISASTFYSLIDERGIPAKTQWDTIKQVVEALGYTIKFERNGT